MGTRDPRKLTPCALALFAAAAAIGLAAAADPLVGRWENHAPQEYLRKP